VSGRADYCVYWFRRAHDELPPDGRAGLVGTNTISQNYSREGGLDYIVQNGGTISEAVATQVWSGDAAVHVSIVNWVKGDAPGKKLLLTQLGDDVESPWRRDELDRINSALADAADVSGAKTLKANVASQACYQGQTHGHEGFLLTTAEAQRIIVQSSRNAEVVFPYLTADNLIAGVNSLPERFVIDFHPRDVLTAGTFTEPFQRVKALVLPTRETAFQDEERRNAETLMANPKAKVNRHHKNFLDRWWLLSYARQELIEKLANSPRYAACGRVTKRPIFEFIDSRIHPNDALSVFPLADDYSFGILQSNFHWAWFTAKCSTLKGDFRYTSNTVFDTFPWPQSPSLRHVAAVAEAAVALRTLRREVMKRNGWSLRDLYRTLETPGKNPLRDAHERLDEAVREAYGMARGADILTFLLALNLACAEREARGEAIVAPGLPPSVADRAAFVTSDCIRMPE
jgi:hypothetical protein